MNRKKQVLSFITDNQNKYAYLQLLEDARDVQKIKQEQFLVLSAFSLNLLSLPKSIEVVFQLNSINLYLDKVTENDDILYLLKTENEIQFLIYNCNTQQARLITKKAKIEFIDIKILEIIHREQLIFNGIAKKNEQIYLVTQGQFNLTTEVFEELQQVIDVKRINSYSLLIVTKKTVFEIKSNLEIQECYEQSNITSILSVMQCKDDIYILTDEMLFKYDHNYFSSFQIPRSVGITDYNDSCHLYYYNDDQDLCISSIEKEDQSEKETILKVQFEKIVKNLWLIDQSSVLIIDNSNQLLLLFQPDYRAVLSQYFDLDIYRDTAQIKYNRPLQQPSQEYLISINKNQRTRQNIDEMITLSLKYNYIQLLLLMCARIRVFEQFFIHTKKMSENGNEGDLRELLDMKKLKKCECIESEQVMEELIEECLRNRSHKIFIYFQKLFLENPEFLNNHSYLNILSCDCDRESYMKANLDLPVIPSQAFKREANYIKFLQKAKITFVKDLYTNKEKSLQLQQYPKILYSIKRGMIGNAMQCYECLKPIQLAKSNKEKQQDSKIIKYFECYHAVHKQCGQMQHNCSSDNYNKKCF